MNIKDYVKNGSLKILVKPNARKNELLGYDESRKAVKVAVAAQAEKGRANLEVIKFFSKLLGNPVKIKSGLASKEKVLKIL